MTTEASTVSTDPGLERLKAQRAGHRGALTRYEKETLELICELETETEPEGVSRLETLLLLLVLEEKFEILKALDQKLLDIIDVEDIEEEIEQNTEIEIKIRILKKKIEHFFKKVNSTTKGSPTREVPTVAEPRLIRGVESLNLNSSPFGGYREKFGGNSPHNYGAVPKLPKLTLQRFTIILLHLYYYVSLLYYYCYIIILFHYYITKFCTFWEGFQSALYNNSGLSCIDKFNYLKSILDGNAARAIQGLLLTEGNYEAAVKILQERFGKKQQIISAHMGELLKLQACPNDKASQIHYVCDKINVHVRGLEALGVT